MEGVMWHQYFAASFVNKGEKPEWPCVEWKARFPQTVASHSNKCTVYYPLNLFIRRRHGSHMHLKVLTMYIAAHQNSSTSLLHIFLATEVLCVHNTL